MTVEVERGEALGIADLVTHPGPTSARARRRACAGSPRGSTRSIAGPGACRSRIDLETTAGQGTCLGHRFEHLGADPRPGRRAGAARAFASTPATFSRQGYSLATPEEYDETMDALDRAVGLGRVRVWHLNDSRRELGSRVDRHAGIGRGHLGLEPFRRIVNDPRFQPSR